MLKKYALDCDPSHVTSAAVTIVDMFKERVCLKSFFLESSQPIQRN